MDYHFTERTGTPERFFDLLPPDWWELITPFWPSYQDTARLFTLESASEVLGGGIVFSTVSPDALAVQEEAQHWFDRGYLYIGFLWISADHRGKHLGSLWLRELAARFPGRKFWLLIDDYSLVPFYERNGFSLIKKINAGRWEEWIMVKENG